MGDFAADPADVDKILDAWKDNLPAPQSASLGEVAPSAGVISQVVILTKRCTLTVLRDPWMHIGRVMLHVIAQLLLAAFLPSGNNMIQADVQMQIGGIVLMEMLASMIPVLGIPFYMNENNLVVKESKEGRSSIGIYMLANTLVTGPMVVLAAFVSMGIYYWLQDLVWASFGEAVGLMVVMLFALESLAQLFATGSSMAMAMVLFSSLIDQSNSYTGIFVRVEEVQYPFKILCWITPARHFMVTLTYLILSSSRFHRCLLLRCYQRRARVPARVGLLLHVQPVLWTDGHGGAGLSRGPGVQVQGSDELAVQRLVRLRPWFQAHQRSDHVQQGVRDAVGRRFRQSGTAGCQVHQHGGLRGDGCLERLSSIAMVPPFAPKRQADPLCPPRAEPPSGRVLFHSCTTRDSHPSPVHLVAAPPQGQRAYIACACRRCVAPRPSHAEVTVAP